MKNYIPHHIFELEGERFEICFEILEYAQDYMKLERLEKKLEIATWDPEERKAIRRKISELRSKTGSVWPYLRVRGLKTLRATSGDAARAVWFVWGEGYWKKEDLARAIQTRLAEVKKIAEREGFPVPGLAETYPVRERLLKEIIAYVRPYTGFSPRRFRLRGVCPIFFRDGTTVEVSAQDIRYYPSNPETENLWALPVEFRIKPASEIPNFRKFVAQQIGEDCVDFVLQIIGWCMSPVSLIEPAYIFLHGDGGTGKSTFLRILTNILGEENVSALAPQEITPQTAELLTQTLANISSESGGGRLQEEVLKAISSGEPRIINPKYRDPYSAPSVAKLIFALNELPPVTDISEGFWRRCIVLPFSRPIPKEKRDPLFFEKCLLPEIPDIASHAIFALQNLIRNKCFDLPNTVQSATERFREESSPILFFWEDLREGITEGFFQEGDVPHPWKKWLGSSYGEWGFFVPRRELHKAYQDWARTAGYAQLSARTFYRRIERYPHMFEFRTRNGVRGFWIPLALFPSEFREPFLSRFENRNEIMAEEEQAPAPKQNGDGGEGHICWECAYFRDDGKQSLCVKDGIRLQKRPRERACFAFEPKERVPLHH